MRTGLSIAVLAVGMMITAASSAVAGNWSASGAVDDIRVHNGENMYGRLAGSTLGCGTPNFRIDTGAARLRETVSILLTAQATDKRVKVYETGTCSGQFSVINGARILNQAGDG